MSAEQWLVLLALGAFAGAVGQLLRVIAGVAKQSRAGEASMSDPLSPSTLAVGVSIGACAGVLAALAMLSDGSGATLAHIEAQSILGLVAAGYAGTDFIEGVVGRYLPGSGAKAPPNPDPKLTDGKVITPAPAPAATAIEPDPQAVG
jgi:hypothetical protein